jgi:hypothetical protein
LIRIRIPAIPSVPIPRNSTREYFLVAVWKATSEFKRLSQASSIICLKSRDLRVTPAGVASDSEVPCQIPTDLVLDVKIHFIVFTYLVITPDAYWRGISSHPERRRRVHKIIKPTKSDDSRGPAAQPAPSPDLSQT